MNLSLFDTHCDTAYELYHKKEDLWENTCHISLSSAQVYEKYAQLFAVWSNKRLDDQTCWQQFLLIAENFDRLINRQGAYIQRNTTVQPLQHTDRLAILAVEDARLLAGDIEP